MAVNSNTVETFDVTTLREDLQEALEMVSATDAPFMSAIGKRSVSNTLFEWPEISLAAVNGSNRVAEGEAAPGNDAATLPIRVQNYTQISDKMVEVSDTAEAVNGASDAQSIAEQVALKLKELKRDMETMLTANVAASAGSSGTARTTAGLGAWVKTNTNKGTGGAEPTTSGSGNAGYPDAARTDGTLRTITEAMMNDVVKQCWDEGAEPTLMMVGSAVKQKVSSTFTGNSTRYKQADDARLQGAIDIISTDFAEISLVPNRFSRARDAWILDPNYAQIAYLQETKQQDIARTGHATRKLISCEYGLQVTEKGHGLIADVQG
jgi:hypothetical protein